MMNIMPKFKIFIYLLDIIKSKILDIILFIRLRLILFCLIKRHFIAKRRGRKEYSPRSWLRIEDLIKTDVSSYLNNEGKNKHDLITLVDIISNRISILYKKAYVNSSISFLLFIYLTIYVYDKEILFSVQAISVPKDPDVLCFVIIVYSMLGYKASLYFHKIHIASITNSIIIEEIGDIQISHVLKNIFLADDNFTLYRSQSNPTLIQTKSQSIFMVIYMAPALMGIAFILFFMIYIYINTIIIIINNATLNNLIVMFVIFTSISINIASAFLFYTAFGPLKYIDYSNNQRLELLDSVNKAEADRLREKLFMNEIRKERAVKRFKERISRKA